MPSGPSATTPDESAVTWSEIYQGASVPSGKLLPEISSQLGSSVGVGGSDEVEDDAAAEDDSGDVEDEDGVVEDDGADDVGDEEDAEEDEREEALDDVEDAG